MHPAGKWWVLGWAGWSACAPPSCFGCLQPPAAPLTEAQKVYDGIQFHATPAGLAAGAGQAASLVVGVAPKSLAFDIPPTTVAAGTINAVLCPAHCLITGTPGGLSMSVSAPASLDLSAPATLSGTLTLQGTPSCSATATLTTTAQISLALATDTTTHDLGAWVSGAMVSFSASDVSFPSGSCGGADLTPVANALVAQSSALGTALASTAATNAAGIFCMPCSAYTAGCPGTSTCSGTPQACRDSSGQCLFGPSGPSGVANLSGFTVVTSTRPTVEWQVAAGQAQSTTADPVVGTSGDLSIRYWGGSPNDAVADCVPGPIPPPDPAVRIDFDAEASALASSVPALANGYHLGVALAAPFLTDVLRGVYAGGGLCLAIDSRFTSLLSAQSLAAVLPSIGLLSAKDSPAMLTFRPKSPPDVRVGAGEIGTDANGNPVLVSPHLTLDLNDLEVSIATVVDDRYARLVALIAQAQLPLGVEIVPDPTGKPVIEPVLGDLRNLALNASVSGTSLLAESDADIVTATTTLLSVAQSALAGRIGTFSFPSLGNVNLDVLAIHGVSPIAGTADYNALGLFANVASVNGMVPWRRAHTRALALSTTDPPPGPGVAAVVVEATVIGSTRGEVQVRVDGGFWSPFRPEGIFTVDDPVLALRGPHRIEIRGRFAGDWRSLDPDPAVLDVEMRRAAR